MTTNATPAASPSPTPAPSQTAASAPGAERAPMTQAGASPVKEQAPTSPAQPPKQWELKVNGKVHKLTEEELLARAALGEGAQQRFNEAAKIKKQTEAVLGRIRDPNQVMDALMDPALGLTKQQVREAFESWYEREFIEPDKLTEDQKKLRAAESKIKKFEDEQRQMAEARANAEQEALTEQARKQIQSQIIEALETNALPKTNFTVKRLAYWIQRNQANGFDAPISLLVSQVKNEFNSSIRDMVESLEGDRLIQVLGDGIIQKIRKHDLEQLRKLRGGGNPAEAAAAAASGTADDRDKKRVTYADVTDRLRELQRTGRF